MRKKLTLIMVLVGIISVMKLFAEEYALSFEDSGSKIVDSFNNYTYKESKQIKKIVDSYADLHRFNGAILVAQNNKLIFAKGYGMANIESQISNTPKTLFNLGSLSKQFTAAAILKLESEGKLSVNDSVSKFLPDYPQGNLITIHHLLTHSSGIPSLWRNDGVIDIKSSSDPIALDKLIGYFKDKELQFVPGSKYRYNNSGYILLAAIIEKVSQMSFDNYLKTNLFIPAGMESTGFLLSPISDHNIAAGYHGYYPNLEKVAFEHPSWDIGAGSIYSNISDLFSWEKALTEGKILPAKQLAEFFKPQIQRGADAGQFYGYGWFIDQKDGRQIISHNGTTEGFIAEYHRFPQDKLLIIALSNVLPDFGINIPVQVVENISAGLNGEKYEMPPILSNVKIKDLKRLEGNYELEPGFQIAIRFDGRHLIAESEGNESWSLVSYQQPKFNKSEGESLMAFKVINAFIDGNTQFIRDAIPARRKVSFTPEMVEHIKQKTDLLGHLIKATPFNVEKDGDGKAVFVRLTFERGEKVMKVEINEKGELAGWGFNTAFPAKVDLIPESPSQFFADGFAYEEKDLQIKFNFENNLPTELIIVNQFNQSFTARRKP